MAMESTQHYSIAEVAERAGVSRRTVRFYVQRGLIDPPLGRGRGSHYTEEHIRQILQVRRLQREGARLDQMEGGEGPAFERSVVVRIRLARGVVLELEPGVAMPSDEELEGLALACARTLNLGGESTGDGGDDERS